MITEDNLVKNRGGLSYAILLGALLSSNLGALFKST